ncbi:MAG: hypothetical protein ACF8MJ_04080 [Phycisphaerales bacterium JB050]
MPDAKAILLIAGVVVGFAPIVVAQSVGPQRPSAVERFQQMPGVRNIPGLNGQPFVIPGLGGGTPADDKPEKPEEPSPEALKQIGENLDRSHRLVELGIGWLKEGRTIDAIVAFETLRERHPEMAALGLYNLGCVSLAQGDRALAEQFFQRVLAEPDAERIQRLATYNLGSIRLDRVANRLEEVFPGLDPIRNALQSGPEQAWASYDQAVERSIADLSIASAMFRAALIADPSDSAALDNLRYARAKIIEFRREREAKRAEFDAFMKEVIMPQDALQKVVDLTERQRVLSEDTRAARRLRNEEQQERVRDILSDQQRVTAETEDLLRRLDAMARRSEELFGEENPLFAQLYDQLLDSGADAIADAIAAQRWADFELRGEELESAQDLQMQAHEDLRSILEDFAAQAEDLQDLMEQFAEQMRDQIEQAEEEFNGPPPPSPDSPEELDLETEAPTEVDQFQERVLIKESVDTSRRDDALRRRRPNQVNEDW